MRCSKRKTRSNPILYLTALGLFLLGSAASAQQTPAPAPDPADLLVVGAAHSDPSTFTDFGGLCTWWLTCHGTRAQIRWAVGGRGCFASAEPDMPLAVVLRGNGFGHREYNHIQNHLARNRILSISIDTVAAGLDASQHQAAADRAEEFLDCDCLRRSFLDRFPIPNPVDFRRTAIVGHSRGGETARFLNGNLLRNPRFNVRAVIAMAPTRTTAERVLGTETAAYMVLAAAQDADVSPQGFFGAHDTAGSNDLGTPNLFDLDRSMKLFVGGSHGGFSDRPQVPQPFVQGAGANNDQVLTARGYVHAFLRAWLLDDFRFYGRYVRGNDVPSGWAPGVFSQYSDGALRRPVDHFQHRDLEPNALGGPVATSRMESAATVDATTLATTPHAGRVLVFEPAADNAYVRWGIPAELTDARPYRVLSLRLGRLTGSGPVSARLWIQNGSEYSFVDLDAFGVIPSPVPMCRISTAATCVAFGLQAHMATFRVPLQNLGRHDDVRRVYLQIREGGVGDRFILDNLEFSSEPVILDPDVVAPPVTTAATPDHPDPR